MLGLNILIICGIVGLYFSMRPRSLEDGLLELGNSISGGSESPHFKLFVGEDEVPDRIKESILRKIYEDIGKGQIINFELSRVTRQSSPALRVTISSNAGMKYGFFTAFKADDGAAVSLRNFMEQVWALEYADRAAPRALTSYGRFMASSKGVTEWAPTLNKLGILHLDAVARSLEEESIGYRELALAQPR